MERSKKRSRDFQIDNAFTAEEMEAADGLLRLLGCFFVQWAVKRRRSALTRGGFSDTCITEQSKPAKRNPLTAAFGLSWSESDAGGLPPSSKDMSVKNVSRRRLPKRKTHKELKEMVNTLSSEKSRLKKEEEHLMKTYQELREWNHLLKSQLGAHLDQRQQQNLLSIPQPTSSERGTSHGTETFSSVDDSSNHKKHDSPDNFVGTLALSTVYDESLHVGVSLYPHELESSSGSENRDYSKPTKNPSCFLGPSNLNAPTEAMCDIIPNGFHGEMHLSRNKVVAAAETRRRRIELIRVKYAHRQKFDQDT
ncbi:uncharacterized protein LOC131054680 isoform X1 [Cryptomeria japonica]|uniref:uncharacterized protein LOC131054680 isoform X1 n=1 Tax=Cryptomeria japonica TaxID=3369 RepID=UPI0025AB70C9|nr:uncharacterized protein LOC131054680 isoform X1 [Cryptomeria japonica]XP_057845221.1 uncharacterized protein LOC131054680 isoform X1 [Cryptomeria japonica]